MKSLLVDALRRANTSDTGHSVSDSGSFDTADSEFGETANDAVMDGHEPDADELELLASTGVLVVGQEQTDTTAHTAAGFSRFDDSDVRLSIPRDHRERTTAPECVPALARYSPLICILLAFVAAGSWLLYQQVESRYFRDVFNSSHLQTSVKDDSATRALTIAESNVGRFPFIDVPADESAENSGAAGVTP